MPKKKSTAKSPKKIRKSASGFFSSSDKDQFKLMVQSVKDYAIFMLDPSGKVTTWNEGAKRIKGYEAGEIIGVHFSRFYVPEDILRNHPNEELEQAILHGAYEEEGWRLRKDGSRFWANVVITALRNSAGQLKGFAKVTRDLTDRKLMELKRLEEQRSATILEQTQERERILDQLFSESPSFMTLLSVPDYRYMRSNSEHFRLIRKSDVIGKKLIDVEPELESQGIIAHLDNVVKTGDSFIAKELPVHYSALGNLPARTAYLDLVYQPLRRSSGEVYAVAAQGHEVTEMVLSRKAVENERENFRNLFKETPELVCILRGPEHIFEFVNEAHIKAFGFDATGMSLRQAQPQSVEVHDVLDGVYRTGKTAHFHEIAVTLSDRRGVFNVTYSARRNDAGEIIGVMLLGVEVTDQVEVRESLRASQSRLDAALKETRALLDAAPSFFGFVEPDRHTVIITNDLSARVIGKTPDQLVGQVYYECDWWASIPESANNVREALMAASRGVASSFDTEYWSSLGDDFGRVRWVTFSATPLVDASGKVEKIAVSGVEITERKTAEDALARENDRANFLAEASIVLASSLDYRETLNRLAELTVKSLAEWCTITTIKEDRTKERVAFVHRDPEKRGLIEDLAKYYPISADEEGGLGWVLKNGKPTFSAQVEDSQLVEVARDEIHLQIMRDLGCRSSIVVPIINRGRILGAISLVMGNGQRRYTENDLGIAEELGRRAGIAIDNAVLYEQAQRAVKARDEFMSIASHELKTPLTSLKLQNQIRKLDLKRGNFVRFSSDKLPQLIADDEKQVDRLTRLIDDMLDISRIQSGKFSYTEERFDLCDMVKDTLRRFAAQIEAQGIKVTLEGDCSVDGSWDRFRIEQVFVNLLTNSFKYGDGKPVSIQVTSDGKRVRLSVIDQGIGVAVEDQVRIFGQFERAVDVSSVSGLGLGLYISQKIVAAHGGELLVQSRLGEGSTFIVDLPLEVRFGHGSEVTTRLPQSV